ncbi:unnamed protein product (mitochondrion) [Plasmodiophora brassicae]|uniref:SUEL-type lectin domain-containing protein n=1 Tax=Plasmodiophora brassicae TaxID=37360 RepID=A0A3P3YNI5_PLABS|nr:unnamed protein product [Plasmodiophora brassicae]
MYRSLTLQTCRICGIDDNAFSPLSALTYIYLAYNQISSPLSSATFAGLTRLAHLNLGVNQIASISSNVFTNVNQLTYLNLGTNSITMITNGAFDSLTALRTLYLDTNQLSALPDHLLDRCSLLNVLAVHANPFLMRLPYDLFRNLTSATEVGQPGASRPATQIVCWPAPSPSYLAFPYSTNLCSPDGSETFGTAQAGGYLSLTCPAYSVISDVVFASFGTPVGVSGRYQLGNCTSSSSLDVVRASCLKQKRCLLTASLATESYSRKTNVNWESHRQAANHAIHTAVKYDVVSTDRCNDSVNGSKRAIGDPVVGGDAKDDTDLVVVVDGRFRALSIPFDYLYATKLQRPDTCHGRLVDQGWQGLWF